MPLPFRSSPALCLLSILAAWTPLTSAQEKSNINDCHLIEDDLKRLACYDAASGKSPGVQAPSEIRALEAVVTPPVAEEKPQANSTRGMLASLTQDVPGSRPASLADRWDLNDDPAPGLFSLRPYKPMYFLLANRTNRINTQPSSPNSANTVTTPLNLQNTEAKYQISFKAKVLNDLLVRNGSLWFGYTQSSRWQIYNKSVSAAFRETDYEPEVIYTLPVNYSLLGWKVSMLGGSFTHQSNGRPLPTSRSWNRLIGLAAFEHGDWTVMMRPWARWHEKNHDDDNADITDYVGRGELLVIRTYGKQQFALTARHSLKGGDRSRGSVMLDWGFPLYGYLKGHVQFFSGYGESLIDYNHKQTTFGFGISLIEWL